MLNISLPTATDGNRQSTRPLLL